MSGQDLIVIGAGSAGLSVASGAVQMGLRVVLIEGRVMGGDCLNHGCVPSKALIAAASAAHAMRTADRFGIRAVEPVIDFPAVMAHVAGIIAEIAPHDSQERFEGLGVRVIRGMARFTGPDEVTVNGERLKARRIVIATGSRPLIPQIPGLADVPYLTNESVFDLRALPGHLLVLGGGPIGVEMAQAFRRLGAAVTLVEAGSILGHDDPEAVDILRTTLGRDGVVLREQARVEAAGQDGSGVWLSVGGERIAGSHLLVATGRRAGVSSLDLDQAGVEGDEGGIRVNAALRTTNRKVFAIGDVAAGLPRFTHVAGYHAGIVIRQAVLGLPAKADHATIPRVTYTAPELAQIGMTETEAREALNSVETVRKAFAENDRARTARETEGWLKLVLHRGRPVGVTIVGPHAGELLAPWSLAMSSGTRLSRIAGLVLPYPTLSEVAKSAAGTYLSPKLFGNPWVERFARLVQRVVP
ncbi:Putative mercuric reductase protein [Pseudooceanicola batsensis HTCC2597]|uniref:Putative mercuric reductase protein n=1 Tax=Pseudooceanicola batsensis (strain ATCC BAA-863 / DSM 15984 / KCTC 12145 / HTCC2597) TaxID=252305 RepID=A3TU18_PSEBH|nr:FAD-dependent oxidoreductase [Pseudooceanicola batsensis]EAQ05145.1 Putative mercuric reductase protein [Pseudooceanicola batsensis HTCC2597]